MTDIQLGMRFVDKVQAISEVYKWSISVGREYRVVKSKNDTGTQDVTITVMIITVHGEEMKEEKNTIVEHGNKKEKKKENKEQRRAIDSYGRRKLRKREELQSAMTSHSDEKGEEKEVTERISHGRSYGRRKGTGY
ncbi:hypothetical protein M9H77_07151 [Catharanthus roseus]|uniref:Uncharacterized protein n=1 Tax=Catharanthus roseus TaxID=4058 RepID=A0ACC0BU55_CATRO|nr:hypothetical protein M9H77_07151 [Catharanthus roseus]